MSVGRAFNAPTRKKPFGCLWAVPGFGAAPATQGIIQSLSRLGHYSGLAPLPNWVDYMRQAFDHSTAIDTSLNGGLIVAYTMGGGESPICLMALGLAFLARGILIRVGRGQFLQEPPKAWRHIPRSRGRVHPLSLHPAGGTISAFRRGAAIRSFGGDIEWQVVVSGFHYPEPAGSRDFRATHE